MSKTASLPCIAIEIQGRSDLVSIVGAQVGSRAGCTVFLSNVVGIVTLTVLLFIFETIGW
jgi:hypothetical protein